MTTTNLKTKPSSASLIPSSTVRRAIKRIDGVANQALKPPPRLNVPDWADNFRRLSTSSGAIGGKFRTSRVEVARGPMLACTERGVSTVTVMCSTQTLKTTLLENVLGYFAHLDPCPMLLTQPKDGAVKSFSKERLMPMIRATPVLRDVFGESRERKSDDTIDYKEFPGGFLALASSGSPTNLAMRAIRITLQDEIDKYETTKEGDPIILAEERTATFRGNRLRVRVCSPTHEETSRIYKSYKESDQRKPYVRCPHCNHSQTLDFFRHVQWNKSEDGEHFPMTAAIYCESCGAEWTEAERQRMMTTRNAVRWRQTRTFKCCGIEQDPTKTRRWWWDKRAKVGRAICKKCGRLAVSNEHAGFQASKLYSPFTTVVELAQKFIESKDDPESKMTFINTQLGLPFASTVLKQIEANELCKRREVYQAQAPMGVAVLTAGIDVQSGSEVNEGRLEVEVVGWGAGEESWSVDYKVFHGDPAQPALWAELDAYLSSSFRHESGRQIKISAACIDSGGHNTDDVYKFARARVGRNVWAIKGASDKSGTWSPVWVIPKFDMKRSRSSGYRPQIIGVNAAKEAVRQRLLIAKPGPGYCHFPDDRPEVYFDQLMAENLVVQKKAGVTIRKWVAKKGVANEAFDARVYAYAALAGLRAVRKFNLETAVARMAALIGQPYEPAPERDAVSETAVRLAQALEKIAPPAAPPPPPRAAPPRQRVRRSRWMA
ncbi:phage terminase large subunit family protein [Rhodopseudomonas palustris]